LESVKWSKLTNLTLRVISAQSHKRRSAIAHAAEIKRLKREAANAKGKWLLVVVVVV